MEQKLGFTYFCAQQNGWTVNERKTLFTVSVLFLVPFFGRNGRAVNGFGKVFSTSTSNSTYIYFYVYKYMYLSMFCVLFLQSLCAPFKSMGRVYMYMHNMCICNSTTLLLCIAFMQCLLLDLLPNWKEFDLTEERWAMQDPSICWLFSSASPPSICTCTYVKQSKANGGTQGRQLISKKKADVCTCTLTSFHRKLSAGWVGLDLTCEGFAWARGWALN